MLASMVPIGTNFRVSQEAVSGERGMRYPLAIMSLWERSAHEDVASIF